MKHAFTFFFIIFTFLSFFLQGEPAMRYEDKLRIRESFYISSKLGDNIWKGINEVPFVVVLVTDSFDFLINHPYPSNDFKFLENDNILETKIYYRPRQYDKHLLATFPAINGVNCIVVGTPENTDKNSTDWIITLLHEHFHQYEYAAPGYFKSVDSLNLSGGDQSGMWMLNYPFPYDSTVIIDQYKIYTGALSKALAAIHTPAFESDFNNYKTERNKFRQLLKPADYRYFSLQVWQEGIARYTEHKFLEALKDYKASKEVAALSDFIPFFKYKNDFYKKHSRQLTGLSLKEDKRICFYAIGFAEGLLLDQINPDWHNQFWSDKFFVEHYFGR